MTPAAAAAATSVLPDGSALLAPADVLTVLDALADAAELRQARAGSGCLECIGRPSPCESHGDDAAQAAAYRAAAARLGDYR